MQAHILIHKHSLRKRAREVMKSLLVGWRRCLTGSDTEKSGLGKEWKDTTQSMKACTCTKGTNTTNQNHSMHPCHKYHKYKNCKRYCFFLLVQLQHCGDSDTTYTELQSFSLSKNHVCHYHNKIKNIEKGMQNARICHNLCFNSASHLWSRNTF